MASGDNSSWADVAYRVAATELTTNSATWTSSESSALISVTASLINGWTYKIWATMKVNSTVAADLAFMRLREDTSAGTQDDGANLYIGTTNGNGFVVALYAEYTASATGNKTWVVTGSRSAGTGTQGIVCSVNRPCFLAVDRIVS
jgi:hypothetical protein